MPVVRVFVEVTVLAGFTLVTRVFAAGRVFFALAARRGAGFLAVTRFRAFVAGFLVVFFLALLVAVRATFLPFFFDPRAVRLAVGRAVARFFLRGAFALREAVLDRDFFDLGFFVFTTHPPEFKRLPCPGAGSCLGRSSSIRRSHSGGTHTAGSRRISPGGDVNDVEGSTDQRGTSDSVPYPEMRAPQQFRTAGTGNVLRRAFNQRHRAIALRAPPGVLATGPINRSRREIDHRDLLAGRTHAKAAPERLSAGSPPSNRELPRVKTACTAGELDQRSHSVRTLLRSALEYNILFPVPHGWTPNVIRARRSPEHLSPLVGRDAMCARPGGG